MSLLSNFSESEVVFLQGVPKCRLGCGDTSSLEVQEVGVDQLGRVENLVVEIVKSNLLRRTGYEYVSLEVTFKFLKYVVHH